MNKIKNVTFVNGIRVTDMSADSMIELIAQTEADVTALEGVSTESDAITKKIAGLKAFAGDLAKLLDAKKD